MQSTYDNQKVTSFACLICHFQYILAPEHQIFKNLVLTAIISEVFWGGKQEFRISEALKPGYNAKNKKATVCPF